MDKKPPLAPGNVDVKLTFGREGSPAESKTLPPFDGLKGYGGQPLFCHAQSDGTTLYLLIDDVFGGDVQSVQKPLPATTGNVNVAFTLAGHIVHVWDPVLLPYLGARPLSFSASFSPSLGTLHLKIDDVTEDALPDPNHTDGIVSFVLVQQTSGEFKIVWVQDNNAVIRNADLLTDASVVLPHQLPSTNGSITGPMGFSLP
jgi:hypothetical protein